MAAQIVQQNPVPSPLDSIQTIVLYRCLTLARAWPMTRIRRLLILVVLLGSGAALYAYFNRPPSSLTLTGIVTTNDVIVSPQIAGQLAQLFVKEGDQVRKD